MGSLKKELRQKEREWIDFGPPAVGGDISSLIDALEGIDDDDKAALEAARSEAMDVTGTTQSSTPLRLPFEIIDDDPAGLKLSELLDENELMFQEIEEDFGEIDPELQTEYDRLVETLEGIW